MIPSSTAPLETVTWQQELAAAIRTPRELLQRLALGTHPIAGDVAIDRAFPTRVPRYFVSLMRRGDPADPLLAQVLSRRAEHLTVDGFGQDPVGDLDATREPGLLQKYHGRALLVTTGACAVHCRYCFRRHFPYAEQAPRVDGEAVAARLQAMTEIDELILSGGDPLMLSDRRIGDLVTALSHVRHLRRLRIHTRLPVVLPSRITPSLLAAFRHLTIPVAWVIHANHPNEVTPVLAAAVSRLRASGATVLNQSVLLKSVNDDADTLARLSESLFDIGVLPYYLHLLDPVAGAAHFDVGERRAGFLVRELRARLPGYLVPRVVREVPGDVGKRPIAGS